MSLLVAGLILFLGIHLFPRWRTARARVIERLGERRYMGIFSVIALAGLVLIIIGMVHAPYQPLYTAPSWGAKLAYLLMPVSVILLAAANMPTNLKRLTRHPMLWGVVLWSVAHLAANGDAASLLLFGSFGVYALVDMAMVTAKDETPGTPAQPLVKDLIVFAAGLAGFALLVLAHGYLFGVAVIDL